MQLFYTVGGARRALEARPGQTVLEALRAAGITAVSAPCGGVGSCGKCRVRIGGLGWVLACRTPAQPGMELFLPGERAAAIAREGAFRLWEDLPPRPWPELGLEGAGTGRGEVPGGADEAIRSGAAGQENGANEKDRPGTPPADVPALGAAVDLGTTTIVVHLHDLLTGRRLGSAAEPNAQTPFGADLVRRIAACEGDGLAALAGAVRRQLSRMTARLLAEAGVGPGALRAVCIAGNTVMLHILAGLSPASMGVAPFEPLSRFGCEWPDGCGVEAWRTAWVWLCPCAAGYLGGDITAGLLACGLEGGAVETENVPCGEDEAAESAAGQPDGLAQQRDAAALSEKTTDGAASANAAGQDGWRLFLDIGTNGEMALVGPKGILCCATAAGPAFEGAEIRCGMAGAAGAVSGVRWGLRGPEVKVLGGGSAAGICGSGLIEALAMLRTVGAVDPSGRLLGSEEAEAAEQEELADWLGEEEGENAVYLTADRQVFLTQGDLRRLLLAKAAVAAGVQALLAAAGIGCEEVTQVYLAGGFGSSISPKAACEIGLLPRALAAKTLAAGNTAGEGAALALLRADARGRLLALAGRCRYIELATDPFFAREYLEQLRF